MATKTKPRKAKKTVSAVITGTKKSKLGASDPFGDDLFGGVPAVRPTTKKKNSSIPSIFAEEVASECEEFIAATADQKDAKNRIEMAKSGIIPVAEARRIQASRSAGKNIASLKVNGVTYKTSSRYKTIENTPENQARLVELFGSANLPRLLKPKNRLVMKSDALNKENLDLLRSKLGDETFWRLFERVSTLEPTEAFHIAKTLDPEIAKKYELAKDEGLVEQYTPALQA